MCTRDLDGVESGQSRVLVVEESSMTDTESEDTVEEVPDFDEEEEKSVVEAVVSY